MKARLLEILHHLLSIFGGAVALYVALIVIAIIFLAIRYRFNLTKDPRDKGGQK